MVQVGCLKIFLSFSFSSQIWLNWLTDDSHLGYIRKLGNKNTGSNKVAKNIKGSLFFCVSYLVNSLIWLIKFLNASQFGKHYKIGDQKNCPLSSASSGQMLFPANLIIVSNS